MSAPRLTNSKRSSFLFCPRQYFWRYEQELELRAQRPGRRRGTIFGNALQAARHQFDEIKDAPEGNPEADSTFDPVNVAMENIDDSFIEIWPTLNSQEELDAIEIERVKIRVMVRAYLAKYGMKARREVEYELPYRNPATGGFSKTWRIAGKIDGLEVVGPKRGRIVEDKFVGQIQKAMIDRLPLDAQMSEYVQALRARGWSAEVAYRYTRVPGVNPEKAKEYKKKDDKPAESMADYEVRLEQDVADRPAFYLDEQILVFPQEHLDEFEQERWSVGQMIIEARARARGDGCAGLPGTTAVGRAGFPKNPTRCWEYGGCAFIPLCTGRPDAMDLYHKVDSEIELSSRDTNEEEQ